MPPKSAPYRERARRAVEREISEIARRLFAERGYEATTINDIAAEVGMSARTVFRYFPTKEDLIVGKMDHGVDRLLAALASRPAEEPVWTSMTWLFAEAVPEIDGFCSTVETARDLDRVIFDTPSLHAAYLKKLQQLEDGVELLVRDRAKAAGEPYEDDDPIPRAIVGAAFGCFLAAQRSWLDADGEGDYKALVDLAMGAVKPVA